jgi:hypothetical protein
MRLSSSFGQVLGGSLTSWRAPSTKILPVANPASHPGPYHSLKRGSGRVYVDLGCFGCDVHGCRRLATLLARIICAPCSPFKINMRSRSIECPDNRVFNSNLPPALYQGDTHHRHQGAIPCSDHSTSAYLLLIFRAYRDTFLSFTLKLTSL